MQNKKKGAEEVLEAVTPASVKLTVAGKTVDVGIDDLLLMAKCVLEKGLGEQDDGFAEFVEKYPDVRELPEEVAEQVKNGVPLLDAYREYELATLKAKLAALETNEHNAKKAPGSANGDAADDEMREIEAIFDAVFKR